MAAEVVSRRVPGTFAARLMFRVGSSDETFVRRGLAQWALLVALDGRPLQGAVEQTVTSLWGFGDGALDALRDACATLRELPEDVVEAQRVKLAEHQFVPTVPERALEQRFGHAGYGLAGVGLLGPTWLGRDGLRAFAEEWLTSANVVLWMTDEPPPGFALGLPDGGERRPATPIRPLELELPAFTDQIGDSVGVAGIARRSKALRVGARLAAERAGTGLVLDELDDAHTHATLGHDGADPEGLARIWDALNALADEGPTAEELGRRHAHTPDTEEHAGQARLNYEAGCALSREPARPDEELEREPAAPAVAAALDELRRSAILLAPEGCALPLELPYADTPYPDPVDGDFFAGSEDGPFLWIDQAGLTVMPHKDHAPVTLYWPECVFAQALGDGSFSLRGRDRTAIALQPAGFRDPAAVRAALEARIPRAHRIALRA